LNAAAEAPAKVALGLHENNKLVLTEWTIRNAGHRALDLSKFRGGCPSCISFGLPSDAGLIEVDQLSVPPGESVSLSVRINIHGTPRAPFRTGLSCATNDPRRPTLTT